MRVESRARVAAGRRGSTRRGRRAAAEADALSNGIPSASQSARNDGSGASCIASDETTTGGAQRPHVARALASA